MKIKTHHWAGVIAVAAIINMVIASVFFDGTDAFRYTFTLAMPLAWTGAAVWAFTGIEIEQFKRWDRKASAEKTDIVESVSFVRVIDGQRYRMSASGEEARKWGILLFHRAQLRRDDVEELKPDLTIEKL